MSQQLTAMSQIEQLAANLDDYSCPWCENTSYSIDDYKGTDAILYADCGVPLIRQL